MKILKIFLLISVMTASMSLSGQNVLDGLYIKEHTIERKPITYSHLREADVMWSKRVWRYIDLREKINHPLYYPKEPMNGKMSLFDVLLKGIKEGSLIAFAAGFPVQDDFRDQLSRDEIMGSLCIITDKEKDDVDNPGSMIAYKDTDCINSGRILGYELKEDWFFDRQRSVMDVRIIGICPIYSTKDAKTGDIRGKAKLCWLYFPNCREIFANSEVFNRANDAERRTFDDIFWKRTFGSYITKESNIYDDRQINEYLFRGIDQQLEADKIKKEIFDYEINYWQY